MIYLFPVYYIVYTTYDLWWITYHVHKQRLHDFSKVMHSAVNLFIATKHVDNFWGALSRAEIEKMGIMVLMRWL